MITRLASTLLLAAALTLGARPAAAGPHFNPPRQHDLALGDSLAFGFQWGRYVENARPDGSASPLPDIHPSDAGYAVIADLFWGASGYDRLIR